MAKSRKRSGKCSVSIPKVGDAFLIPLADGRFGFCRVLESPARVFGRVRPGSVAVETSAWVGEAAPDLNDPRLCETLVQTHHGWGPNPWRVIVRGAAPESFRWLGTMPPRPSQPALGVFTLWESLATEVLLQWRWDHDRESLLREEQQAAERSKAELEQAAKREQEAIDALTLESLRDKRRFAGWKAYRPDKAIAACRAALREAIDALIALGPRPTKRAVAAAVRRCVEQLNSLDEQYDGFIETGEREELCREIDKIVHAAGLRNAKGMADRWREW
jgi:hypothetical protein